MRHWGGMRQTMAATALAAALPGAALADEVAFSADYTNACLEEGGWSDCIGLAAQRCMEFTPGGYSTYGMNACIDAERQWWDDRLNASYRALREIERATDADAPPGQPSLADALREMQRAWIGFRDASCNYEVLQWYGGTGAGTAWQSCQMRLTAEQSLVLQSHLNERQP